MDDFRIKDVDPGMAQRYADMIDRTQEWHAPIAHAGGELPSFTPEQQDKLAAELAELIRTTDFSTLDVSAMPVTAAPIDDGKLHFKKQSDPGY